MFRFKLQRSTQIHYKIITWTPLRINIGLICKTFKVDFSFNFSHPMYAGCFNRLCHEAENLLHVSKPKTTAGLILSTRLPPSIHYGHSQWWVRSCWFDGVPVRRGVISCCGERRCVLSYSFVLALPLSPSWALALL